MCDIEKIETLQNEIRRLKLELQQKEQLLYELKKRGNICPYTTKLSTEEVSRYSRQMLVPQIGLNSQLNLKDSSLLIVGIGGLGCPAAQYLTAAGVGTITLMDYDDVELTNLHRQILHSEHTLGQSKVESAYKTLLSLNSNVKIIPLCMSADGNSLRTLFKNNKYDVVLDCSDNVATRYLLNDVCVLNKVPLVSGSALQLEGQLTVYNYKNGPCYRCLFPKPPPVDTVTNCGDGGVLGVVPGVLGVLQALETIKILTASHDVLTGLLVFDASCTSFMKVKLRNKNPKCEICGECPKIHQLIDYEEFCGSKANDKVIDINMGNVDNISVKDFAELGNDSVIVDVRPKIEYDFCKLPNTINLPFSLIMKNDESVMKKIESFKSEQSSVYFICRRGNDSQRTVSYLKGTVDKSLNLVNVKGGLHAFSKQIDPMFPVY